MTTVVPLDAWGSQPPLWIRLLATEVARGNRTQAARRIGISRTAVSLVLVNRYPSPSTARIERKVLQALGQLDCLAKGQQVTLIECQDFRERPAPTHNPMSMRHWRACQHCPNNPHCAPREDNHHARLH